MGIPGGMMPGAGGMMPGAGGGGGLPVGPMGGLDAALQALASLQQQPPPDGEAEAMRDASVKLAMALSRIQLRSSKAARLLSEAISKIQSAREALSQEASRPFAPPPDLGMPGAEPAPTMPMPGF